MTQRDEGGLDDAGPVTEAAPAAGPAIPAQRGRPASLWRHRDFMLLWGGQTVSDVGSAVTMLALPLLAVSVLKATTFEVSLISILTSLAFLLISLPAGVIVDQVRKHGLMMWCDAARMVLLGSIPLTGWLGQVTLWQIYVVATLAGILSVFFDVSYQSYVPVLLDGEQLVDANGKLGATNAFAGLVGPSVGGALVGFIGAAKAVAADAGSFAASAVSLLLIRTPEPRPEKRAEHVTFRAAMNEGLSFVVRHPILRKVVACTGTSNFFSSGVGAVDVVFLVRVLHASPSVVGALFSLAAIGGVIGGMLAGRLGRWIGTARIIWVSTLVPSPLFLLMPLARPGWGVLLFAVGLFAQFFLAVVYNTAQVSYRQRICPPQLLGRMNASVRWIVWGTMPLGALFGGALGTWIGVRETIAVCAVGAGAAGLWVFFSPLRHLRDVPDN